MSDSKSWWNRGYFSGYWGRTPGSGGDSKSSTSSSYEFDDGDDYYGYSWKDVYKSRYKSSLGFGTSKLSETASSSISYYTSYYKKFSDVDSQRVLLESAYKTARDLVIVLDFPFKIHIQLSSEGTEVSGSPGDRRLFIPTSVLDDSTYDTTSKINICCGLAIHEAAHLKFTELKVLSSFMEKVSSGYWDSDEKISESHINFVNSIINLIEDERVEDKLLTERPGYTEFIDKAKSWNYKKFISAKKSESGKVEAFLNNLFRLIRYPEGLEDEVLSEYHEQYNRIQALLNPLPRSTKEACISGFKIYKEIISIFSDLGLTHRETNTALSDFGSRMGEGYIRCMYGVDTDSHSYADKANIMTSISTYSSTCEGVSLLAGLVTGSIETGTEKNVYFEKPKGSKTLYQSLAKEVSPYVSAIRKLIRNTDKNYDFNIYGCRTGKLDTAKLAEAYQGVPQVYIRSGRVTTNNSTVCVLIDESGSMRWEEKDEQARKAAILLNEALKDLPNVDLYIYGHTADTITYGTTELSIYREGNRPTSPYALSDSKARFENRDGTAIYEAGQRVRRFTKNPCIMFVISDGEPAAYHYGGSSAISDVRKNVTKLENDGFTVIQITIDTVNHAKEMFTHVIDLKEGIQELPNLLSKVIKKAIINDKKTTIS